MEIIEAECANCNKKIFIQEESARELLFCTLKCMGMFNAHHYNSNNIGHHV